MTTTIAPPRTREQRLAALAYANEIRIQRAQLKRNLRRHPWMALHVIAEPAPWLETMTVRELLLAIPRVGWARAATWLDRSRVSHAKTLGGMTQRQRDELAGHVQRHIERRAAA